MEFLPDPVATSIHRGIRSGEVPLLQKKFGKNNFEFELSRGHAHIIRDLVREPMFLMLLVACILYFVLGQVSEGAMMLVAMAIVVSISLYQGIKSSNALKALQDLTSPKVKVVRDGEEQTIPSVDLVPGDIMILDEGMSIPADAEVLQQNDLSVNESVITGESVPVEKYDQPDNNILWQGSFINSGKCVARVTATGSNTVLGKSGKAILIYTSPKTPLQIQINRLVRLLAFFGLTGFVAVFLVNYFHQQQFAASLLLGLTLAMSAVPEEIPVAFSSFMALGAYRMSRLGIISRQPQVVENLGAVSIICLDKTGTITENSMSVNTVYDYEKDVLIKLHEKYDDVNEVLLLAVLASEKDPFDTMEQAIWKAYRLTEQNKDALYGEMIFEYPLQGRPPMMTHVYKIGVQNIAAAKGAVERIVQVCRMNDTDRQKVIDKARALAANGYRIIAVAKAIFTGNQFPQQQQDYDWLLKGFIALYDPPKKNSRAVIDHFYEAGIKVKLLTGDYPETAMNIAGQVGIWEHSKYVTGEQVMEMSRDELIREAKTTNVFVRMFPDAKLKTVEALQHSGEIVAMTGDGVNDAPALKRANIGIAMGKRGTQLARQAADLVLIDDDLSKMVSAISEGRKIFSNLKKAARYIISIHIPIILVASLPLILGWRFPTIFTPIHIIFMELIMGPTCSIFFEREPVENDIMQRLPRRMSKALFTRRELVFTISLGLTIAAGALCLYLYFMNKGAALEYTRTIVFTELITANVFLTFAYRSFSKTIYQTSRYKNNLAGVILVVSVLFLASLYFIPFVQNVFGLVPVAPQDFWLTAGVAFICVMWFEVYKIYNMVVGHT
jgi:P-type Ca2+ transporter type 2C